MFINCTNSFKFAALTAKITCEYYSSTQQGAGDDGYTTNHNAV